MNHLMLLCSSLFLRAGAVRLQIRRKFRLERKSHGNPKMICRITIELKSGARLQYDKLQLERYHLLDN